jgi:hypothetical protein
MLVFISVAVILIGFVTRSHTSRPSRPRTVTTTSRRPRTATSTNQPPTVTVTVTATTSRPRKVTTTSRHRHGTNPYNGSYDPNPWVPTTADYTHHTDCGHPGDHGQHYCHDSGS